MSLPVWFHGFSGGGYDVTSCLVLCSFLERSLSREVSVRGVSVQRGRGYLSRGGGISVQERRHLRRHYLNDIKSPESVDRQTDTDKTLFLVFLINKHSVSELHKMLCVFLDCQFDSDQREKNIAFTFAR